MGGVHAVQSTLLADNRNDSVMRQSDHAAVGRHTLDPSEGKLVVNDPPFGTAGPGAEPRPNGLHSTRPFALVDYVPDSSVGRYGYDADRGTLKPLQITPSTPDTFTGANTASEIDISRSSRFAYGPDRGHDSIGVFSVEQTSGCLTPVERTSSQGKGPRFMAIEPSGAFLDAANENSDTIVTFKVDEGTGRLSASGQVLQTGSPGSHGLLDVAARPYSLGTEEFWTWVRRIR